MPSAFGTAIDGRTWEMFLASFPLEDRQIDHALDFAERETQRRPTSPSRALISSRARSFRPLGMTSCREETKLPPALGDIEDSAFGSVLRRPCVAARATFNCLASSRSGGCGRRLQCARSDERGDFLYDLTIHGNIAGLVYFYV